MEVGDKCWIYFNLTQEISEGTIVRESEIGYDVKTDDRDRPYFFLKKECFASRESLCEHYRKIFE